MGHISLSWCTCHIVSGRALHILQGGVYLRSNATHLVALWCCMWGREPCCFLGSCPAFSRFLSFPQANNTLLGAALMLKPSWVGLHSRTPWAPHMESPGRLSVYSTTSMPAGFYSQSLWSFIFLALEPWVTLYVLGWNPGLLLPQLFHLVFICTRMWSYPVCHPPPHHVSSLPWLPISACPTSVDEFFFFNSLVVRLLRSSIVGQFWLFLFLNWLLSSFWLCEETKYIYLGLHLGQKF